jgi:hypothetical protein
LGLPAIDEQVDPRGETAVIGSQERDSLGDLVGQLDTPNRDDLSEVRAKRLGFRLG